MIEWKKVFLTVRGQDFVKKRGTIFFVLLLLIGILSYPMWKEKLYLIIREPITKDNTVSSMEELENKVLECLEQGKTEENFYLKGVSSQDLEKINANLDGYYGYVTSYYMAKWPRNGLYQVKLNFTLSDNYYAYHYLTEGIDITGHDEAKKLAKKAESILKKIIKDGMSDYEKEKAIHDYIVTHGEYAFLTGEKEEDSYDSKGILLEGQGVCSSYSESMQLLLSLAGVESKIVLGEADIDHSWNLVKLDGNWYHVDVTWDDPVPDEEGRILYNYFNVPDELLAKTHTWDTSRYEKANSYQYNYYGKLGNICNNYEETKARIIKGIHNKEKSIELLLTEEKAKDYAYNFVLQYDEVASVRWKTLGESPCFVITMTLDYVS